MGDLEVQSENSVNATYFNPTISLSGIKADEVRLAIQFREGHRPGETFHYNFSSSLAIIWDVVIPLIAGIGPFLEQASRFTLNATAEQHGAG